MDFLTELRQYQELIAVKAQWQAFIHAREVDRIIYTLQQSIGCIGDSFPNPNQSRKRIGQLFENLIRLIIQQIGLECQSRTITLPIPGYPGYQMQYELDVVFSRAKAILTSEAEFIHATEIVGSVNKPDGVYYVDPRPEMTVNQKLREQVRDFQPFLIHDI